MDHLQDLDDRCDSIDATVFSSDMLFDDEKRMLFKRYVERWARALAEHEKNMAADEDYNPPIKS